MTDSLYVLNAGLNIPEASFMQYLEVFCVVDRQLKLNSVSLCLSVCLSHLFQKVLEAVHLKACASVVACTRIFNMIFNAKRCLITSYLGFSQFFVSLFCVDS